jgi:RNA 2',3'-cyclic 3'-phosphodiesterase
MRHTDHPDLPGFDLPSNSGPTPPKHKRQKSLSRAAVRTTPNLVVSPRTENLFLAILPDSAAAFRIRRIAFSSRVEHNLSGRVLDTARLHLSLHSLGPSVGDLTDYVSRCRELFAPLAATIAPFEIVVDRALSFKTRLDKLPFVLRSATRNSALMNLYSSLAEPFARPKGTFTPHVTVLYDPKSIDEHPVEPVSWIASEVVLVRSLVGQGIHEHLARWPLHG